jgi:hypothetical protein
MEVIFKTLVGSKLYGLATENSDTDYKGVFMAPVENVIPTLEQTLGLKTFTEMERYEPPVVGEGKDKVEAVYFSARYFIKLYLKGNPTLAEIPFAGDEFVEATDMGRELMKFVRDHMVTRHLFGGYYGYYMDQVKGFTTGRGVCREKRHELIEKYGYDTKMGSHAYRIGVQGVELFKTGKINPTLSGEHLETARKIKVGGFYNREWLMATVEDLSRQLKEAERNSTLPEKPDFDKVHDFILDFNKRYYGV